MPPFNYSILFEIPGCTALQLDQQALPSIQTLLEKCDDFYILVSGLPAKPDDPQELFTDLPPGKTYADKTVIGFYKGGELIGILDSIRGYPAQGDWFIGLMVLDPAERGNGLGRSLLDAYESWAASFGAQVVWLGVVEENQRGLKFWQQSGFQVIEKRPPRRFGNKEQAVYLCRKSLLPAINQDDKK